MITNSDKECNTV